MVDNINGTLYLNNPAAKEGFFNHAATIDGDHTIDSAVCAGPVTFTGTITVEGYLVIV
jgi:hypothetical protein|tara:strand:+ start:2647 stop:2820 length:174 start_codon:yes stop_codon:yes gene_type:complete